MKKLAATIFFDAFALMLLGLIIVMSASSTYSSFRFDDLFHLFNSHVFKVVVGIGLMILFCFIPYEVYKEYSKPALIVITVILFLTLFIAPEIKGAGRRIDLGPLSFQPSDAAKLFLMIHLAALLEQKKDILSNYKNGFLYLFFWVIVVAGLILIQPNVSNAVLLVIISLTMMYIGGARLKHIASSTFFSLLAGGSAAMIFPHSRGRILTFIESIQSGGDINLQVKQALYSFGSGGVFGVGMGHSKQSNLFLPEAYGDFIFAIFGEELGFVGTVLLMLSFLVFFFAGILIAKKTKDQFGQLLAFGITFSIILYAFVNMAVATGLFPTTGLPLPFISYGGTSLIFVCISVGILVNIALSNNQQAKNIMNEETV
ncbi:MAG: putative peptidoglycan glycosyltransferase FtsW [Ignavibacteriaceae bacterium]